MAAGSIGNDDQVNAIQTVAEEMKDRLCAARDRLDEIRRELK